MIRGGGWGNSAQDCRVASRCYFTPLGSYYGLGFALLDDLLTFVFLHFYLLLVLTLGFVFIPEKGEANLNG